MISLFSDFVVRRCRHSNYARVCERRQVIHRSDLYPQIRRRQRRRPHGLPNVHFAWRTRRQRKGIVMRGTRNTNESPPHQHVSHQDSSEHRNSPAGRRALASWLARHAYDIRSFRHRWRLAAVIGLLSIAVLLLAAGRHDPDDEEPNGRPPPGAAATPAPTTPVKDSGQRPTPRPPTPATTDLPSPTPSRLPVPAGQLGVPITLTAAAVDGIRPGDHVHLFASDHTATASEPGPNGVPPPQCPSLSPAPTSAPAGGSGSVAPRRGDTRQAVEVAADVLVLAVRPDPTGEAAILFVALSGREARTVAGLPAAARITAAIRSPTTR